MARVPRLAPVRTGAPARTLRVAAVVCVLLATGLGAVVGRRAATATTARTVGGSGPAGLPPAAETVPGTGVGIPAGTSLVHAESITVTTPGTELRDLDIHGTVVVDAPGTVIRRTRFTGNTDAHAVVVRSGDVLVEDCEITGDYTDGAVVGDAWTVRRCDVHDLGDDGFKLGNHTRLEHSHLHDWKPRPGQHADGAQLEAGVVDVVVRANTIDIAGNSAIFLAPDLGPSTPGPVLIEDNVLGGGNYTVFNLDGGDGRYHVASVAIRGNRFLRSSRYGPVDSQVPVDWADNTWADTGAPVSLDPAAR